TSISNELGFLSVRDSKTGRFCSDNRLVESLPARANPQGRPKVFDVCVQRPTLPIHSPSLRARYCTTHLHYSAAAPNRFFQKEGIPVGGVSRRFAASSSQSSSFAIASKPSASSPSGLRVYHQLEE